MSGFADAPRMIRARGDVAVWVLGAGDPVLVLHGFPDAPIGMTPLVERLVAATGTELELEQAPIAATRRT